MVARRLPLGFGRRLPSWSPSAQASLAMWLDASQITGLVDGDPVTTWGDMSGQGNSATQSTGAAKPLYKTGIANGRPGVLFDGVDDFMSLPSGLYGVLSAANKTVIIAVKWAGLGSDKRIIAAQNGAFAGRFSIATFDSTHYQMFYQNGTGASNIFQAAAEAPKTTGPQIVSFFQSGTAVSGLINGTSMVAPGSDGGAETLVNASLGSNGGGTAGFANVHILEIIAYSTGLSASDRARVERYMGAKYGVAVS